MTTLEETLTALLDEAADAGEPDMTRPELQALTIRLARGLRPILLSPNGKGPGRPPADTARKRTAAQPTARELETLILIAGGGTSEEAAAVFGIKPDTVRSHMTRLSRRWNTPGAAVASANLVHRGFADGWLKVSQERMVPAAALGAREMEVLGLLALGLSSDAIGERLGVSVNTVASHSARIFVKLGARSKAHAVAQAWHAGLLPLVADVVAA